MTATSTPRSTKQNAHHMLHQDRHTDSFFTSQITPSIYAASTFHSSTMASTKTARINAALTTCTGIVSPLKQAPEGKTWPVQPGNHSQRPPQYIDNQGIKDHSCVICGVWLSRRDAVREHFVSCVNTNGNPQGRSWDYNLRARKLPLPSATRMVHG